MKVANYLILFGLAVLASNANSTEFTKTTTIAKIVSEGKRPAYPDVENNDFLELDNVEPWSGSSGCHNNVVVIPEGKAFMRSVALAAIASGKTVEVRIDNTLPKLMGSYCQITLLGITK